MSGAPEQALAERRRAVDAALQSALRDGGVWPATLHKAMRYSVFAGGKRLRPLLALSACEAVGGSATDAMPFACALELVHTFSLIHDDLPCMDDDDLRRGQPTSHKVFGEAVAILAGDALLARAFELLAGDAATPELLRRRALASLALAEAVGGLGMLGGQVEDLESEGRDVTPETLDRIHRCKTGALLQASVRGGAILGGASAAALEALTGYAAAVGLAFQIVDDVLDATSTAEQLGKTAGKDKRSQKATYVRVHGLDAARARASALGQDALDALEPLAGDTSLLAALARLAVERQA